ncbi:DUF805 domain-containing protein [uncultured Cohaesibacter sp.]|uniref:DUF805 domain-containing protein n=1 Tax=uncultured Cohaesibacter sp. TaxID=1002546 RepID=UPI00292EF170|nr:DUF805 domain-containing protein [uncultured Cohaesibacter sp.]
MSPIQLVEHSLVNCLQFNGRAGRGEFWLWFLFSILMTIGLYFIGLNVPLLDGLWKVWFAIMFMLSVPLTVRRLHDMELTGKWFLIVPIGMVITFGVALVSPELMTELLYVPVALVMVLYFVIGFVPGWGGENRFGDPYPPRKSPFDKSAE